MPKARLVDTPLGPKPWRNYGWKKDSPDPRDRIYDHEKAHAEYLKANDTTALPLTVDLRPKLPEIWDQEWYGSCTANGVAAAYEYTQGVQGEKMVTPSRMMIWYDGKFLFGGNNEEYAQSDGGVSIRDGVKGVRYWGACPETQWPYTEADAFVHPPAECYTVGEKHKVIEYSRVYAGDPLGSPLRTAVADGYPIVFGFIIPFKFEYSGLQPDGELFWNPLTEPLIIKEPEKEIYVGEHCNVVVGYDFSRKRFPNNDVFLCRNSWGLGFGESGYSWFNANLLNQPEREPEFSSDFWIIKKVA